LPVLEIIASVGAVVEPHRMTFGTVDGPRPRPKAPEAILDHIRRTRQWVADEASWKHIVQENTASALTALAEIDKNPESEGT